MYPVCQGIGEIRHPQKIKAAQGMEGMEHRRYCLPFTQLVNNCQTVEADEGSLSETRGI